MINSWRTDVPTTERLLELLALWREPWYWRNQWDYRASWNALVTREQDAWLRARELESSGDESPETSQAIRDGRELAATLHDMGEPDHQEVLRYAAEWRELEAWLDAHLDVVAEPLPALDLTDVRPDDARIEAAAMQIRRIERAAKLFLRSGESATIKAPAPAVGGETPADAGATGGANGSRTNYNAAMIDLMQKRPEARDWSAQEWAEQLGCTSKGTIHSQPAWKSIMAARKAQAAVRVEQGDELAETDRRKLGKKRLTNRQK